jgi:DNA-3-methyladenine glycosylase
MVEIDKTKLDSSKYSIPQRKYFARDTLEVARSLPGAYLSHITDEGPVGGMIVEAEAYRFDEAGCHAYNGETPRNKVMFGPPGYAYVYFTYGNHWMFNIVTEKEGYGCAVLIRALEPMEGIDLMWARRPKAKRECDLTNGPGKLAAALGINKKQYGWDLLDSPLQILVPSAAYRRSILKKNAGLVQATRVGLGDNCAGNVLLYRFYLAEHPCVSVREKKKH